MVEFNVAGVRTVAPTAAIYHICIYDPLYCQDDIFF